MAGKSVKDKNACAAGAVALAIHVRTMAPYYGIPVIIHTDHCAKKLLPWFDAMLEANEAYFAQYGEPLFSSHMLDLSEEPDEENIAICVQYFKKMGECLCNSTYSNMIDEYRYVSDERSFLLSFSRFHFLFSSHENLA